MMNLYDFIIKEDSDYDTYDTVYDICVTVCVPYRELGEEMDWFDKFYNFILQHVEFIKEVSDYECTANWSRFIEENINVFTEAANEFWYEHLIPKNQDDMIYEWIKELHGWLSGYVSECEYHKFMEKYAPRIKELSK